MSKSQRIISEVESELIELRETGRYYRPPTLQSQQGPTIRAGGRTRVNLASNNYLGLANHPVVVAAAHDALDEFGFGLGTGRLISSMTIHEELEQELAIFKQTESALVCQTGYDTNLAALSSLLDSSDLAISDELNHASIVDGLRMSGATKWRYPHSDLDALSDLLVEARDFRRVIVVTDGVFSMEGDIARLPEIVHLAKIHDAYVYVDDAHGEGVLGQHGGGIVEHYDLHGTIDIEMGTLSKAFAGVGGFIAGDKRITDYVFQKGRPFMFATGHLPPAIAAGIIAGIRLLRREPNLLQRLWANTQHFRKALHQRGFDTGRSVTPIVPVILGEAKVASDFSRALWDRGVYVQAFSYPIVPKEAARVRAIVTAAHAGDDLDEAIVAFEDVANELGLLR